MVNDARVVDVFARNEGSVVLIQPLTQAAKDWLQDNVESEPWQWLGSNLVVDHRFADGLLRGMTGDGLDVEER